MDKKQKLKKTGNVLPAKKRGRIMENKREGARDRGSGVRGQGKPETRNHVIIEVPTVSLELTEEQKKKFLKRYPAKPAKTQPCSSD